MGRHGNEEVDNEATVSRVRRIQLIQKPFSQLTLRAKIVEFEKDRGNLKGTAEEAGSTATSQPAENTRTRRKQQRRQKHGREVAETSRRAMVPRDDVRRGGTWVAGFRGSVIRGSMGGSALPDDEATGRRRHAGCWWSVRVRVSQFAPAAGPWEECELWAGRARARSNATRPPRRSALLMLMLMAMMMMRCRRSESPPPPPLSARAADVGAGRDQRPQMPSPSSAAGHDVQRAVSATFFTKRHERLDDRIYNGGRAGRRSYL